MSFQSGGAILGPPGAPGAPVSKIIAVPKANPLQYAVECYRTLYCMSCRTWESRITNILTSPSVLSWLLRLSYQSQSCLVSASGWWRPRGFLALKQVSLTCLRTRNIIDMHNGLTVEVQLPCTASRLSEPICLSAALLLLIWKVCNVVWEMLTPRPCRDPCSTANT